MTWHARMFLVLIVAILSAVVASGLDWGLPQRTADTYLFASHRIWSGDVLTGFDKDRSNQNIGADVDRNPVDPSADAVILNANDQARAEIIRRFRLFSSQPDEMITFMSLQQMKPGQGDLDPRLYQYGGLWIYPVGGLLKAASMIGLIDLRSDAAFYYDHPEAFGRFYIVARAYTLFWYAVLLTTCAAVTRKITCNDFAAIAAAAMVGVCPVVFAMAHEAKPHLPGAALMLIACFVAIRYIYSGLKRDALLAGITCGLATGMVLSTAVIGIILPAMAIMRKDQLSKRFAAALIGIGGFVLTYSLTNPYVPINLIRDPSAVISNFSNTAAMYGKGTLIEGLRDGSTRLIEAASVPVLVIFACAMIAALTRRKSPTPLTMLLTMPTAIILAQFFLLAAGKPSEYARFAIFPTIVLAIGSVWVVSLISRDSMRGSLFAILPVTVVLVATMPYVLAFSLDARNQGTRSLAAIELHQFATQGKLLHITAEPAPYCLPPLDLWRWRLLFDRDALPTDAAISIRTYDTPQQLAPVRAGYTRILIDADQRPAPITWANKPFEILLRD